MRGKAQRKRNIITSIFPFDRITTGRIAVALLAVGLFAGPAYADEKNPTASPKPSPNSPAPAAEKQQGPKEGTREATEAAAKAAEDAFNEYQKLCWGGTDEEKAKAQGDYDYAMLKLDAAIKQEMPNIKEVRAAQDNYNHYEKKYLDPNAGVDAHEQARQDVNNAAKELSKARREAREKIEAALKKKYHYEEQLSCPKKKGETSGPLDFLGGSVEIGIGVGGGHREGYCGSRKSHEKKKGTKKAPHGGGCVPSGSKPAENKSSVPHGCGCGPH